MLEVAGMVESMSGDIEAVGAEIGAAARMSACH